MKASIEPILIVDDDEQLRELLLTGLGKIGRPMHGVENTHLAKQWLASNFPCIIILDIMMPDGNGLDFCRWVRSQERLKAIPIIVSSGIKDEETVQDVLNLGATDFVRKPFHLSVLEEKIQRFIKKH